MKNNNKTKLLAKTAGVVLVLFQMISNSASADYCGYWMDAVQNYQSQSVDYRSYNEPMYAEPVYQEPQYPTAAQYHDNLAFKNRFAPQAASPTTPADAAAMPSDTALPILPARYW